MNSELNGGAFCGPGFFTLSCLSARLRYLARVGELEATDTEDPNLNYGLVVDCGSSGSRIFVYFWPRHNGNPHDLLDIKQMRDRNSQLVVKKIKPGTNRNVFVVSLFYLLQTWERREEIPFSFGSLDNGWYIAFIASLPQINKSLGP